MALFYLVREDQNKDKAMRGVNPFEEWFASYEFKTGIIRGWVWGLFDFSGEVVEMKDYIKAGGVLLSEKTPDWAAVATYLDAEPGRVKAQEREFGKRLPDFIK